MKQIICQLQVTLYFLKAKAFELHSYEDGSVAETVVLTAVFVALAIVAGTIIFNAVKSKATSITYNTPNS
jgi:hypothetical protein